MRLWIGTVIGWYRAHSALMKALHEANAQDSDVATFITTIQDRVVSRIVDGHQTLADDPRLVQIHLILGQLDSFCMAAVVYETWGKPINASLQAGVEGLVNLWVNGFNS